MEGSVRFSRRAFVAWVGGAGAGFYLFNRVPGMSTPQALAQIPGGSLDPLLVPKFETPMLVPPVMPRVGTFRSGTRIGDLYEISMRQFKQQILPASLPKTTVWGYGTGVAVQSNRGLMLHNAPSLTIEAQWMRPVRVKWVNELTDGSGNYLSHLLPVDQTLHWANPPGGPAHRDSRPEFTETPGRYTGPVPIVTHVHGAVGVVDDSDGYAEAWYLPAAKNIGTGYATTGTWYDFFAAKAKTNYGVTWGTGFATFQYPNENRASTIWYHDHALGMTRLNVYAGPAGFYIVRGGPAADDKVLDTRTGAVAALPGPAPRENDKFPPNKPYREIPIAIQDRAFNDDGSLFYPDSRAFFDGIVRDYIPTGEFSPIWNPEFFGNTIMVNGNTWPFLTVERLRYRFRLLNGCQSRFLVLDFTEIPGVEVWQIGNEGGLLAAPVNITATRGNRLLMGLAERADVIVDFTKVPTGNHILRNSGPDEPFGGGEPPDDFDVADPNTTGQVMQFRVVKRTSTDKSTPPNQLVLPAPPPLPPATTTRQVSLNEEDSQTVRVSTDENENVVLDCSAGGAFGPRFALLGTVDGGAGVSLRWDDPITENPAVGATEVWEMYNFTEDAHPIHIHEITFQVLERQPFGGAVRGPEIWETGRKDTVIAYPGEITRVKGTYDRAGLFVWHCHIVEHEDHEMMRPYRIGP
jgi:FtsP/CotA-like multicopper oxidase with cupredoxin domain